MKIPYNSLQLMIASVSAEEKLEKYIKEHGEDVYKVKMQEFGKTIELPKSKAEINKMIAEHNGISVETLINSVNYQKLNDDFSLHLMQGVCNFLKQEFGFNETESYALIASSMDLF